MGGFNDRVVGLSNNQGSNQNYEVNIKTNRCVAKTPMPIGRFSFGICTYGEWIIVVSGLCEIVQEDFG